jgi:heme A synthase
MKTLLVGAVGMLALQALLVGGWLALSQQTPFILTPPLRGALWIEAP